MQTAIRLLVSFLFAYAPAVFAMALLPAIARLGFGVYAFLLLSSYLFIGAPWAWIRLDRTLVAALARARRRADLRRRVARATIPFSPERLMPVAMSNEEPPMRSDDNSDVTGSRSAAAVKSSQTQRAPVRETGFRATLRASAPGTLGALLVMNFAAAQVLSASVALIFFSVALTISGLAWLSMTADAQTLRRRGRPSPNRAILPTYALCIGVFLSAALISIWTAATLNAL